ncbi:MAG TPA: S49 family peptidase [Acetobacteraceae bacterium]|jgi:signal peptide peptidase SppA|nr:S49 family peptidase [Acetobacteraceae bacterium]
MKLNPWAPPRVRVLRLHGILGQRGALNIEAIGPLVDRAFRGIRKGDTVLLDIDSRGGSPVQSELIATRIRRRAEDTGAKVRAVIGEVGASGGYWLACAADEIVAHPLSIVGSIGVIGGGFGLHDAIARIGVERRVYTAGKNKARLDPFSPERPEDVAFTRKLLDELHDRFKEWVRTRRGARLSAPETDVFDGSWMLGEKALAAGLVDRLGDLEAEVKEVGGKRAKPMVIRQRRKRLLARLPWLAAEAAIDVLEERMTGPTARF